MSHNNELLAAELELLADEARLGRGVSPELACLDGRRILRRRRVLGTTGGVGATGLALLLAVFLLPVHGRGTGGDGNGLLPGGAFTAPAGSPTDSVQLNLPSQEVGPPRTAPAGSTPGSDPLNGSAVFGWLPTGFTINGYNTNAGQPAGDIGPEADKYPAVYETSAQTADGTERVSLTVLPSGVTPFNPNQAGSVSAPPVNGKTAYWQTEPADQALGPSESVLVWQYQPGSWAELSLDLGGGAQNQVQNTAARIARGVRFGQTKAIPLPFERMTAPAGLGTVTAGWTDLDPGIVADSTWEETLSFANGPNPAGDSADGYSALQIGVTAAQLPPADAGFTDNTGEAPQTTNLEVDGFSATLTTSTHYALLTVDNAEGFGTIEIQGVGDEGTKLALPGAAAAVFEQLNLLGTSKDDWTTNVVADTKH